MQPIMQQIGVIWFYQSRGFQSLRWETVNPVREFYGRSRQALTLNSTMKAWVFRKTEILRLQMGETVWQDLNLFEKSS